MAERIIGALAALGKTRALVYFGHDGLDELTTTTTSTVYELVDGEIRSFELDPMALGFARADAAALAGGDAAANAAIVRRVLGGEPGPIRDIVVLNAAAALVVADLVSDMTAGVELAGDVIDDGRAAAVLDAFIAHEPGRGRERADHERRRPARRCRRGRRERGAPPPPSVGLGDASPRAAAAATPRDRDPEPVVVQPHAPSPTPVVGRVAASKPPKTAEGGQAEGRRRPPAEGARGSRGRSACSRGSSRSRSASRSWASRLARPATSRARSSSTS